MLYGKKRLKEERGWSQSSHANSQENKTHSFAADDKSPGYITDIKLGSYLSWQVQFLRQMNGKCQ